MLTRVPDYYEAFHCLAGACPHTCCEKWEVVVDEETARRYQETPGSLGERLREALQTDEEGDFCFPLRGGRCPFLNRENLCEIHRILGAEATSLTCRTHPRFIEEYGPFREVSLCASCPAACDLLLGSTAPLSFLERETAEPEEPGDPWLCGLLPLRERMLRELADRPRPLQERLEAFLLLAAEAQILLDEDRTEDLAVLAADWKKRETAVSTRPAGAVQAGGPGRGLAGAPAQGGGGAARRRAGDAAGAAGHILCIPVSPEGGQRRRPAGAGAVLRADGPDGTAPDGSMWLLGGCPPPLL